MTEASDSKKLQYGGKDVSQQHVKFAFSSEEYAQLDDESNDYCTENSGISSDPQQPNYSPYGYPIVVRSIEPPLQIESNTQILHTNPQTCFDFGYYSTPFSSAGRVSCASPSLNGHNFNLEQYTKNGYQDSENDVSTDRSFNDFGDGLTGQKAPSIDVELESLNETQPFNYGSNGTTTQSYSNLDFDHLDGLESAADNNDGGDYESGVRNPDATNFLTDAGTRASMQKSKVQRNRAKALSTSHRCNRCPSTFSRASDLRRHYAIHFPEKRIFQCRMQGCNRNGQRGFFRRDKLRDHQRKAHKEANNVDVLSGRGILLSMS